MNIILYNIYIYIYIYIYIFFFFFFFFFKNFIFIYIIFITILEYFVWRARKNNLNIKGHIYNIKDNTIHDNIFVPQKSDNVNVLDYSCEKGLNK